MAAAASQLPDVTEGERHSTRTCFVGRKAFAWERPFSKADVRRFGDQTPPGGPILAVRVADLGEKEALLAAHPEAFFTIPHFAAIPPSSSSCRRSPPRICSAVPTAGWPARRRP